ncbi:MAG TPA: hypothetical protein V6D28_24870 [Leptolyngbyaceae cyanobacterium]
MHVWSAWSGIYSCSVFTMYEEEAWRGSLDLQWDDTGRVTGSGRLNTGEDFITEDEGKEPQLMDVVFLGQIVQRGNLYGIMVAPNRFEKGICWTLDLEVNIEQKELAGEVFYSEDYLGEGEPGSISIKYERRSEKIQ